VCCRKPSSLGLLVCGAPLASVSRNRLSPIASRPALLTKRASWICPRSTVAPAASTPWTFGRDGAIVRSRDVLRDGDVRIKLDSRQWSPAGRFDPARKTHRVYSRWFRPGAGSERSLPRGWQCPVPCRCSPSEPWDMTRPVACQFHTGADLNAGRDDRAVASEVSVPMRRRFWYRRS
jgi:hypothetical protein